MLAATTSHRDAAVPQDTATPPQGGAGIPQTQNRTEQNNTEQDTHNRTARAAGDDDDQSVDTPVSAFVDRLYARHPKKKNLPLVQATVVTMHQSWNGNAASMMAEIDRVHTLWCDTDEWKKQNGRFAPPLDQWLVDRGWTKEPDVW